LKKHVNVDHFIIVRKIEKEINNEVAKNVERQLAKERPNVQRSAIFGFFCCKITFRKG
jgi:hypothetical protein